MSEVDKSVFISYRRKDSSGYARAVYQALKARGCDVFLDVEDIGSGRFEQIIKREIESRVHFVVILTPSAVKRCNQSDDWLRREIELALALEHVVNIVPLSFDGFTFKKAEKYLTGKLSQLQHFNALEVSHSGFEAAMDKLVDLYLKRAVRDKTASNPSHQDAYFYFERALKKDDKGDFEGAILDYIEAVHLYPKYAIAYYNLGLIYHKMGLLDLASLNYKNALNYDSSLALAHGNLANIHKDKGDLDAAILGYSQVIAISPDDSLAYYNRGLAYFLMQKWDDAITDYDNAIRLNSNYLAAHNNRASTYAAKRDFSRAISGFRQTLTLDPSATTAYRGLGICFEKMNWYKDALQNYQKYLDLEGTNADNLVVKRVYELKQHLGL